MLSLSSSLSLGFASMPDTGNPCQDKKPYDAKFCSDGRPCSGVDNPDIVIKDYFENRNCAEMMDTGYAVKLPQAGMDVTSVGTDHGGQVDPPGGVGPIEVDYSEHNMCVVNVHWHLGAEHKSDGQFDVEEGQGPGGYKTGDLVSNDHHRRKMVSDYESGADFDGSVKSERLGLQCHHYDATMDEYTKPYDWKYCKHMEVGQTYEVHWPHSAAGMCNTKWQMQTPFYDGVFCKPDVISLGTGSNLTGFNVHDTIGVQGQVFTIVNSDDAEYQKINLFDGAWQESVLNSTHLPHGRVWVRNPNQPSPP
jgi:hypothetical protein